MGLDASCDALVLRGVSEALLPPGLDGPAAGLLGGCRELRVDRLAGEDIVFCGAVKASYCQQERMMWGGEGRGTKMRQSKTRDKRKTHQGAKYPRVLSTKYALLKGKRAPPPISLRVRPFNLRDGHAHRRGSLFN